MEPIPHEAKSIIYYYAALTFVAVLFALRRKQIKRMRLKLGGRTTGQKVGAGREDGAQVGGSTARPPAPNFTPVERSLNVMFNWNGHSWDAYEVLGLPAGSSIKTVEVTFAQALREQNADSHPFLRAAFEAIRSQRSA